MFVLDIAGKTWSNFSS